MVKVWLNRRRMGGSKAKDGTRNRTCNKQLKSIHMAKTVQSLPITGRPKKIGLTFYIRNGKPVTRVATSLQPKRRTRKQFVARQQMLHSTRLWAFLKWAGTPMFPTQPTAYSRFLSLMHRTEIVFLPKKGPLDGATILLPDIPVSEGTMPTVKQDLGEVNGATALITNLTRDRLHRYDTLILYTLTQHIDGTPKVWFSRREVTPDEMTETADGLALISEEFDNDMKGWALVHVRGESCSTQTVITRSTYYKQFTTEEALQDAAASYGGLTKDV